LRRGSITIKESGKTSSGGADRRGRPPNPIQQLIDRNLQRFGRREPPDMVFDYFETQIAMGGAGVAARSFRLSPIRLPRHASRCIRSRIPWCRSNSANRESRQEAAARIRGLQPGSSRAISRMGGALVAQVRLNALGIAGLTSYFRTDFSSLPISAGFFVTLIRTLPSPPVFLRRAFAARDDGTGVAHALSGWCRHSRDKATTGFFMFAFTSTRPFSSSDPRFAHHDHGVGLRIVFEHLQYVDVFQAVSPGAAGSDAGGLPSPSSISCPTAS